VLLTADVIVLLVILLLGIGIGIISSMLGIGGGIVVVPLLVVLLAVNPRSASAISLLGGMFVATSSTISYSRQVPRPTMVRIGLLLTLVTVPGSILGAWLASYLEGVSDMAVRYLFAAVLFPIALKMVFPAKKKESGDVASELAAFRASRIGLRTIALTLMGSFIAGVLSGLLGLGGGAVVVPLLTFVMRMPMHGAVATSMLTMVFTTFSGTCTNVVLGEMSLIPAGGLVFGTAVYGLAIGIGMLSGAPIGVRYACRVKASSLKAAFGIMLIYPIIRMAELGQSIMQSEEFIASTTGDLAIWLAVVLPVIAIRIHKMGATAKREQDREGGVVCDTKPPDF